MLAEKNVLLQIEFGKSVESGLLQKISELKLKTELIQIDLPIVRDHILKLQDELWWIRFIDYCNTPCWRFNHED